MSRTVFSPVSCFLFLISVFLKVLRKGAFKDVSYELDNLLEASPASASVLDIIAASASQTFPNGTFVEDAEAGGSEIVGYQLDGLVGSLRGSGPGSASVLDIATASASRTLPMEASAVDAGFSGEDQGTLDTGNATSITRQT